MLREPRDPVDQGLRVTETVLNMAKVMTPQIDVAAVSKSITDAVKMGMETSKSGNEGRSDPILLITTLIDKLLPVVLQVLSQPKPQVNEMEIMRGTISMMKDMGALEKKPDNTMEVVKQLREGLGMKFPWEEKRRNALDTVGEVSQIIQAVSPLVNPNAGPPSIAELIMQNAGKILEPLTMWAEAKRMEVQAKMKLLEAQGMGRYPVTPTTKPRPEPPRRRSEEERLPSIEELTGEHHREELHSPSPAPESPHANPIVREVLDAIEKDDEEFFNQLSELIFMMLGPNTIDGLVSGKISLPFLMKMGSNSLGVDLSTIPKAKPYFEKFVEWLRVNAGSPHPEPVVSGRCEGCGEEYDFDTEEDWENDNKICDACGGKVIRVVGAENPTPGKA